ncbi:hypothetical protein JB92DRAFT_3143380 [Gautieria morchelliformis]|nr:hypothetical protein JB92DRAFT_3143380 [Gautieria morchelliformis]
MLVAQNKKNRKSAHVESEDEDANGSSDNDDDNEVYTSSESEEEEHRSRHKHKHKRKHTLISRPFGTAGKKGDGLFGSKGYNLQDHMGLADDNQRYLDIRCATRLHKAENQSNDLSAICADVFERSFAIQWLTRFVSLFSEVGDESSGSSRVSSQALEEAASLLAICAGAAASGTVTRTFTFPLPGRAPNPTVVPDSYSSSTPTRNSFISVDSPNTVDEGVDEFTVMLRDAPLESSDFSSVGAQTWGV